MTKRYIQMKAFFFYPSLQHFIMFWSVDRLTHFSKLKSKDYLDYIIPNS